jgi:hypothetical protein
MKESYVVGEEEKEEERSREAEVLNHPGISVSNLPA